MAEVKIKLSRWLYSFLGPDCGGTPSPPGSECELDFGEIDNGKHMHVARTYCNDGHELWLGYPNKWHVFYSAKYARQLAWFILWDWWAVSTWFGLKRKIWYWALCNIVEYRRSNTACTQTAGTVPPETVSDKLEHLGDENAPS